MKIAKLVLAAVQQKSCNFVKYGLAIALIVASSTGIAEEEIVIEDFIQASLEGLQIKTESHDGTWGISKAEAWEFVAVANRLAESNGGYRGDAGGAIVFMTFGEISLRKDSP